MYKTFFEPFGFLFVILFFWRRCFVLKIKDFSHFFDGPLIAWRKDVAGKEGS